MSGSLPFGAVDDGDAFDAVMGPIDPAMAVVTTAGGTERAGCLVGFHCQCSIEPSRYAVWLSKANHTLRVALLAEHVAVHLLDESDGDLAELFGTTSGDDVDKFARCEWTAGPAGVPLLARVGNRLVGAKHTVVDDGSDHVCFILAPVRGEAEASGYRPLRLSAVRHLEPGHEAEERQRP
jgi:flavin reductase (DIM6/NTAB) family NADH-FMN oxidoreductase RutF